MVARPYLSPAPCALDSWIPPGAVRVRGWGVVVCLGRLVRTVGQGPRRRRTNRLGRGASKSRQGKYKKGSSVAVFE